MNPVKNNVDLRVSISAAMEEIMNRTKVTLDEGSNVIQPRNNDISALSKEERDFYKLMFGDDLAAVRHRRLHCTACDVHLGSAPVNSGNMYAHPVLFTLLCVNCRKFYGDGNFEQGEDATDMFCRWCANGGNLYCCSYCSNTFCDKCIKRNFDPVVRKKIEDEEKWKCFVCDPTDLYTARAVCWALLQHIQTVTRILKNDRTISKDDFKEKMNLDESKCCSRKRKAKRRKLSSNESEEDESYQPSTEELSLPLRRKILKRSPRLSSMTNGDQNKSLPIIEPKQEIESFNNLDDDDDPPPPMIPCVQSMVEGDSSETLTETLNLSNDSTAGDQGVCLTPPTLHINPIPTANLLKVTTPPALTPIRNISGKRKQVRSLQHILPAPKHKFVVVKNKSPQNCLTAPHSMHTINPVSLRSPGLQPNVPMVAIPAINSNSPSRVHTIEYSSLPLRAPSIPQSTFKKSSRMVADKAKPASSSVKEVGVIEIDIDSDSDEPEKEDESKNKEENESSRLNRSRNILKNMLNKSLLDNINFPDKKRFEKPSNKVEEEIDLRTEEVRMLFKMIGTKLRRVPLLHLPNHNNLRSTRVKTRRFHLALTKAISVLSDINDKVVSKYSNWRKSMLEESRQTRSNDASTTADENIEDFDIPLDMICTNSESDSDNNVDYDSDSMFVKEKIRSVKTFQERDTIDVGVGDRVSTADKSVQAFDVVERDYEKCIGHSVLTKIEYDPIDGSEISKPVIVPSEYNGKFEEQFIFYLQDREDREVETDDDLGLPDPNETPLKDLIESNSPFVLEMLESIDSPLANGTITNEIVTELSNESGIDNECEKEPINVVKALAKMVTDLSEDIKSSENSETLSKKHSEHGKKDKRKQIFKNIDNAEVDIAVQTLIEEDERSRSSSNDDELIPHNKPIQHTIDRKDGTIEFGEDECTIIE